jgi:hypothetical protein
MPVLHDDLAGLALAIARGEDLPLRIDADYVNYPAAVALEVYRNNYRGNLHAALAGAYPVVEQLVGEAFFRRLTRAYIACHPSRSGNLHDYGDDMAQFIAAFEPARALAYLADVAALEWACHRAYFAGDAGTLDVVALARLPHERYPELVFHMHQACSLLHSRYPVAAIWQVHQAAMPDDCSIDLDNGPCHALVLRRDDAVGVVELPAADAAWLQLMHAGMPLGAAVAAVLEHHPDFDFQAALTNLVGQGVLAGFTLETTI